MWIDNEVGFVNYIPGDIQLVLKEIYQPGYTSNLYNSIKEKYAYEIYGHYCSISIRIFWY